MAYRCIIVDDEELARELMETHISKLDDFELVASCESAVVAHQVLQNEKIDLLFLDIEMPVLMGTDFYKNLITKPKVIFTTAFRDYALDGFDLSAIDFLLKPIIFSRFMVAIEKFRDSVNPKSSERAEKKEIEYIYVQSHKKNIKIELDKILYVESLKDYIKIHLSDDEFIIKHGLGAFEDRLDDRFLRVHRSFIVNINSVTAYTKNDIEIGDLEIPIGDLYKKEMFKKFNIPSE
ncbi:LytTR family DNA-binding domain-containing protein [Marivirga arenosa]|uniref:LytTR family DNA-binding domain-containing protein n=1 Tax=Marivirga arenosa TaxID=3059076 RepID=A0AA49GFE9_9BACT|nr:LytTR family DNA-binding domain-containing protein [Marivirga sp. ABR2-2]WKK86509.2 LytTR family DNA-binding domain-containing protein [Marivirga sp. ABR2-2]